MHTNLVSIMLIQTQDTHGSRSAYSPKRIPLFLMRPTACLQGSKGMSFRRGSRHEIADVASALSEENDERVNILGCPTHFYDVEQHPEWFLVIFSFH